jgi:hypothetical protein
MFQGELLAVQSVFLNMLALAVLPAVSLTQQPAHDTG